MISGLDLSRQIYCFDIFDTIVSRTVDPEYVKKIWSREIKQIFRLDESAQKIYRNRFEIEAALCDDNQKKGYDLEFQYANMVSELKERLKIQIDYNEFLTLCLATELEIEERVQRLCDDVVDTIRELKHNEKTVICISDFYLPKEALVKLLSHHGIAEYIDDIYVSSEKLLTKRTGRLYQWMLENTGYLPEELVMIGDNEISDVRNALNYGITGVWIDRKKQHQKYEEFRKATEESHIKEDIWNLYKKIDRDKYQDMTFVLYNFIEKLYSKLRQKKIKDVLFFSREGEFLKKIFDYYQNVRVVDPEERIRTHYFLVSRKSTLMPSLDVLEKEKFEIIFRQYINISVYDFLMSLGFEESEVEEICKIIQVDSKHKYSDFPRESIYNALIQCEKFKELYEVKRIEQKRNFAEYLKSFNFDYSDRIALVDVGWKGTIQDNLFIFFDESKLIQGMYIGLVAPGKENSLNQKEGLIFDCVNEKTKFFNVYNENKSIFEVLLGASHGSADHYENIDGKICVKTAEKEEEKALYQNLILPIQKEIMSVFTQISECLINRFYDSEELENVFAEIHAKLVYMPTKKQMDIFYNIYHYENFGVFEFSKFKNEAKVSCLESLKSLCRLIKNKRAFFNVYFWSVLGLRDAGLKFLVRPYGWYMLTKFRKEQKSK